MMSYFQTLYYRGHANLCKKLIDQLKQVDAPLAWRDHEGFGLLHYIAANNDPTLIGQHFRPDEIQAIYPRDLSETESHPILWIPSLKTFQAFYEMFFEATDRQALIRVFCRQAHHINDFTFPSIALAYEFMVAGYDVALTRIEEENFRDYDFSNFNTDVNTIQDYLDHHVRWLHLPAHLREHPTGMYHFSDFEQAKEAFEAGLPASHICFKENIVMSAKHLQWCIEKEIDVASYCLHKDENPVAVLSTVSLEHLNAQVLAAYINRLSIDPEKNRQLIILGYVPNIHNTVKTYTNLELFALRDYLADASESSTVVKENLEIQQIRKAIETASLSRFQPILISYLLANGLENLSDGPLYPLSQCLKEQNSQIENTNAETLFCNIKDALNQMSKEDYLTLSAPLDRLALLLAYLIEQHTGKPCCEFLPPQYRTIGAAGVPFTTYPFHELAILNTPDKVLVCFDDVYQALKTEAKFSYIQEGEIKTLPETSHESILTHFPQLIGDIRVWHTNAATQECYTIPDTVLKIIRKYGQLLLYNSTDDKTNTRYTFNGVDYTSGIFHRALGVEILQAFMAALEPWREACAALEALPLQLPSRRCATTLYGIINEATYQGCSGQLGIAFRQYIKAYEDHIHAPHSIGLSRYSRYLPACDQVANVLARTNFTPLLCPSIGTDGDEKRLVENLCVQGMDGEAIGLHETTCSLSSDLSPRSSSVSFWHGDEKKFPTAGPSGSLTIASSQT